MAVVYMYQFRCWLQRCIIIPSLNKVFVIVSKRALRPSDLLILQVFLACKRLYLSQILAYSVIDKTFL